MKTTSHLPLNSYYRVHEELLSFHLLLSSSHPIFFQRPQRLPRRLLVAPSRLLRDSRLRRCGIARHSHSFRNYMRFNANVYYFMLINADTLFSTGLYFFVILMQYNIACNLDSLLLALMEKSQTLAMQPWTMRGSQGGNESLAG
ncbi:hypothetical protein KSP40_PGU005150 [Platanthera guangdongensis]|uniref:Uncharacterized protein n=1 Tax=Platanthera guangdongensis TaxID=2320717 RepID=A0ABR2N5D6_9ASPA